MAVDLVIFFKYPKKKDPNSSYNYNSDPNSSYITTILVLGWPLDPIKFPTLHSNIDKIQTDRYSQWTGRRHKIVVLKDFPRVLISAKILIWVRHNQTIDRTGSLLGQFDIWLK